MGCGKSHHLDEVNLVKKKEQLKKQLKESKRNIREIYKFVCLLGKGSFGTVKLAQMRTNHQQKIAVKIIERSKLKNKELAFLRELEILRSLDHPNIVKFYELYWDEMFFYICMEYCEGGELLERITQKQYFKEQEVSIIMEKLLSAVNYIHSKEIVHRDLKLENILFATTQARSDIKIIDFGLSSKCDGHEYLNSVVGTPLYVSPSILKGKYDKSCDNWSLGVILYILLVGYPPFYGDNKNEIFQKISKGQYSLEGQEWDNVSDSAKDLVKKLLVVDSKKIISIKDALLHPWILLHSRRLSRESPGLPRGAPKSAVNLDLVDPKIINLLKNFKTQSKLKAEVMKVLVNQLSEKEIESLKEAFYQFDLNSTGTIKISDLQYVMEQAGFQHTKQELQALIKNISPNSGNDYTIQYSEFIAATLDQIVYLKAEKIWSLFKYFDRTNTNAITVEDLKEVFLRNGRIIPDEDIEQMVKEVDPNCNGRITLEVFKKLMIGQEVDYKD